MESRFNVSPVSDPVTRAMTALDNLPGLPVSDNELACLLTFPEGLRRLGIAPFVKLIELAVRQPDSKLHGADAYGASTR
jgi:hypothetical protein